MNLIGSRGLLHFQVPQVVLKLILSCGGLRVFILPVPEFSVLKLGGVVGEHHQRTDLGLQVQNLCLFQRTFRWNLIGGEGRRAKRSSKACWPLGTALYEYENGPSS